MREVAALSDCYTPRLATRSLDLLHVAAATLLGAKVFYSFDERQRKAAAGEGLKVGGKLLHGEPVGNGADLGAVEGDDHVAGAGGGSGGDGESRGGEQLAIARDI